MLANLVIAKETAAKAASVTAQTKAREARKGRLLVGGKASPKQLEKRGTGGAGGGTDDARSTARWDGTRERGGR